MNRIKAPIARLLSSRSLVVLLSVVVVAAGAGTLGLWPRALPAVEASPRSFPAAVVARGAALAAIGNCAACHSAPGQAPYSGGPPVATPFGTVYASNLTPDPDTGIGLWSEAAFIRAMRQGIDREGRHLYPAFPYDHFTLVSDEDDRALYAFLTSRPAAHHATPPNALVFPLNFRTVVAGWNLLFLKPGPYRPDPAQDETWNRGAYLVEGLGHCGACHTPRNVLGAEQRDRALSGGMAEGWNAYALNRESPAPVPWTVASLSFYLRHGWEAQHGVSRGPMAVVTANLGAIPEADLHAMAVYLVSGMDRREPTDAPQAAGPPPPASAGTQIAVAANQTDRGAVLYAGACASCHDSGRPVPFGGLPLGLSSALHAPDPTNLVTVTLHGLPAPPGAPGAIMPGFEGSLDDGQMAALLAYLRSNTAHKPPWPDLDGTVRKARTQPVTLYPSDGTDAAPADTDVRISP